MYYIDSREQHGSGRRAIQQKDQLRGGLGGGYGGDSSGFGRSSGSYGSGVSMPDPAEEGYQRSSGRRPAKVIDHMHGMMANQDSGLAAGRRHIQGETHMANLGLSNVDPAQASGGRQHIEAADHMGMGNMSAAQERQGLGRMRRHYEAEAPREASHGVKKIQGLQKGSDHWDGYLGAQSGPESGGRLHGYVAEDHMANVGGGNAEDIPSGGRRHMDQVEDRMINMAPEETEHAELHGRRHMDHPDHMSAVGVSKPAQERHGRGRRYIDHEDHQVIRDFAEDEYKAHGELYEAPHGRRAIQPEDHLEHQVFKPMEEIQGTKPPSNAEMKDAIKEWLLQVHDIGVIDESRWADAEVKYRGCHWCIEAFNHKRVTLSREGPTARAIAEKLSMMPLAELRYFGVRFCGSDVQTGIGKAKKGQATEHNPTLVSPGVHTILGNDGMRGGNLSTNRKEFDGVQRRYIASGQDHFQGQAQPLGHGPRMQRDTDFADGMERGVGHGKRYIGSTDNAHTLIFGGQ